MDYIVHQASLSVGSSRQEYWTGLPLPSPEDLPNPGTELVSPATEGGFLTTEPPGRPQMNAYMLEKRKAMLTAKCSEEYVYKARNI